MLELRKTLLPLAPRWYTGLPDARGVHDLAWLRRTGQPLEAAEWSNRTSRIIGALIGRPGGAGAPLLLLFNGRDADANFTLPPGEWLALLDTTAADGRSSWRRNGTDSFPLQARSVVLLRDETADQSST